MSNYIDLHAHSTFSSAITSGDAYGTPQRMVERAVELGWSAVCLTDHGWMGGAPALYKAAKKAGIKPIIGCELYVTPDFLHGIRGKDADGHTFHLTALALSKEGYENLVAWESEAMQRDNYHRKPRISLFRMVEIAPHPLHHNVIMSGCLASELCRTLADSNGAGFAFAGEYVRQMKMLFPNFYIELWNHEIPKFMDDSYPAYLDLIEREAGIREQLIELARQTDTPMILTNDSHMQYSSDRRSHIALKASGWRGRDDDHMKSSTESLISKYLPDYTYFGNYMRDLEKIGERGKIPPSALDAVSDVVAEANISLEPLDRFSYSFPPSGRDDPVDAIRHRSKKRLREMSERHGRVARDRFELELEAMKDFADYLLLMSDFIKEAHRQGILTWTRGSAANSFLAYCLGIHDIDTIGDGLLFSRFFNPARKKLPDIDVDIDPSRYDDFMHSVHAIMEPLVGEGQVVQISNWGTAANRSAFRMAASALGMPKEEQDEIAKLLPQLIDEGMMDEDEDVFTALREDYPELYEISSSIFDSIRNVSQHACAWVFGTPQRPISEWVPLYLIASSGTLVTQYDFKTLEDFGLTKMDFLRLKTLTVAAKTLQKVGRSPLDFYEIPLDDEETFEMVRAGKVDGVHTLQGKETRKGLAEIQPETYHDLALASALYRPAHTREGRDKLYVDRRRGHEKVRYPHPIVEEILSSTQGIPVYQEQAMEICYACGMDDAGVDDVYQAIKKAKGAGRGAKEAFAAIKPNFIRAAKKVIKTKAARAETWEAVKSFQGYGFNKGHAYSYGGYLATRMAYLKCHYPAEFWASVLDVFPEKSSYIASVRAEGFEFLEPCINRSNVGFENDRASKNSLRVGLGKIRNVGTVGARAISEGQRYESFEDFRSRVPARQVNARAVESLQRTGALSALGIKGDEDEDTAQFQLLGFTLRKPRVFRGCKPRHDGPRTSDSGWKHLGREKGLDATSGRSSVSKLFWIPEGAKLELKASPWAHVKCWLLEAVDENGIKFHLMVNEDKDYEARLVNFLHKKCQGAVICADGMNRLPFVQNGPPGFRFFGITGSYNGEAQMWHLGKKEKKFKKAVAELAAIKRRSRYS